MTLLFYDQFPNNSHSSNSRAYPSAACSLNITNQFVQMNLGMCESVHYGFIHWAIEVLVQYISPCRQLICELDNLDTFLLAVVYNLETNQHVVLINSEMERLGRDGHDKEEFLWTFEISSELQVSGPRFDSLLIDFMMDSLEGCRPRSLSVFGVNGL